MFYADGIGDKLRFGDVVRGFLSTCPILNSPLIETIEPYTIEINTELSVVLDPCCSIGNGTISISPLIKTQGYLWDNPHLFTDITEINRKCYSKELMPPVRWNRCTEDEKTQFINTEKDYGYKNLFIYERNNLFDEYEIMRKNKFEGVIDPDTQLPKFSQIDELLNFKTRYHMINFKDIRHVTCKKVLESEKDIDDSILESIVLQLSDKTRNELRLKMGDYFARIPNV